MGVDAVNPVRIGLADLLTLPVEDEEYDDDDDEEEEEDDDVLYCPICGAFDVDDYCENCDGVSEDEEFQCPCNCTGTYGYCENLQYDD